MNGLLREAAPMSWASRHRHYGFVIVALFLFGCSRHGGRAGSIHKIAKSGDVAAARALLAREPSLVHARDRPFKRMPLYYAAREGHTEMVELLLGNGADVDDFANMTKETALMKAAKFAHVEVIRVLLEHGANPNIRGTGTALGWVIGFTDRMEDRKRIATLLLEHGATLYDRDLLGYSPIDKMRHRKSFEWVEFFEEWKRTHELTDLEKAHERFKEQIRDLERGKLAPQDRERLVQLAEARIDRVRRLQSAERDLRGGRAARKVGAVISDNLEARLAIQELASLARLIPGDFVEFILREEGVYPSPSYALEMARPDSTYQELIPVLADALKRADVSDGKRAFFIYRLGHIGGPDARKAVQEQLRSGSEKVRKAAAVALQSMERKSR